MSYEPMVPERRGKLTIFFGAGPGTGKTAALRAWVSAIEASGTRVRLVARGDELDVAKALEAPGTLVAFEDLAVRNAEGARHTKRWLDALDLLAAGIDVAAVVGVHQLESLRGVVQQLTGVLVEETLPDAALIRADAFHLVDSPPEIVLKARARGDIEIRDEAAGLFEIGALFALRALALKRAAERADDEMRAYRRGHAIDEIWPTAERLVVGVSTSPLAPELVRATARLAARLGAEWHAVYVETPLERNLPAIFGARAATSLALAERLGAVVSSLSGERASEELLAYARARNVTKIVVGKPRHARLRDLLSGSFLDDVVRGSGGVDVYVVASDGDATAEMELEPVEAARTRRQIAGGGYAASVAAVALTTIVARLLLPAADPANAIMLYLAAVVVVAARFGQGPSALASVLAVGAFDFFFVPPAYSFAVSDLRSLVTFAVMLAVGLAIASLTARVRRQAETARAREQQTQWLYDLVRELGGARTERQIAAVAARSVAAGFGCEAAVLLPNERGELRVAATAPASVTIDASEIELAARAFERAQPAGRGTDTSPSAAFRHVPLAGTRAPVGVLSIRSRAGDLGDPAKRTPLDAFSGQIAVAIERAILDAEAARARREAEREELLSSLLSSVSHDLRTPLAAITGSMTSLLDEGAAMSPAARRELLATASEEADRLARLVTNLLDMTRLEARALAVKKEWGSIEEVIGSALERLAPRLEGRTIETLVPADLPLVPMDAILVEQVIANLVDNAVKYAPKGPISISAAATSDALVVEVSDRGPGLGGEGAALFEKFRRGARAKEPGTGLGLAICRGMIVAHGGTIQAEEREGGGAVLRFTLPLGSEPPLLEGAANADSPLLLDAQAVADAGLGDE